MTTYRDDPKETGKLFDFFGGAGNPQPNLDR